jgi:hypothetical protein
MMSEQAMTTETKIQGVVKFYDPARAFGFITLDDGRDFLSTRTTAAKE